jgi:hypothetical protein
LTDTIKTELGLRETSSFWIIILHERIWKTESVFVVVEVEMERGKMERLGKERRRRRKRSEGFFKHL